LDKEPGQAQGAAGVERLKADGERLKAGVDWLKTVRSALVEGLIIVVIVIVIAIFMRRLCLEFFPPEHKRIERIYIETIAADDSFKKFYCDGATLSGLLSNKLNLILKGASVAKPGATSQIADPSTRNIKIDIGSPSISIETFMHYINEFHTLSAQISGSVTIHGDEARLVLVADDMDITVTKNIKGDKDGVEKFIDKLLFEAAEKILKKTHPSALAVYYCENGKKDEGLALANEIIVGKDYDDKDVSVAYVILGAELYGNKKYAEAIKKYSTAVDFDPKDAAAYYNWGIALSDLGNKKEAIEKYKMILTIIDPNTQNAKDKEDRHDAEARIKELETGKK
jgi:tetratricopeptide (TPR) repeat protein